MALLDHRPRSASELIDAAIALLRRDYARYCMMAATIAVPWQVTRVALVRAMHLPTSIADPRDVDGLLVVGGITIVFLAWLEATVSVGVSAAYTGGRPEVAASLRTGARRWLPVLLSTLLKYVALTLFAVVGLAVGMLLGILVMRLWVASGTTLPTVAPIVAASIAMVLGAAAALPPIGWFAAVPMTAALEPLGPVAALRRSRVLTRGLWRHAVGVSALAWVIVALPSLAASLLASVLLTPFFVAALTVLYYDLRIRKEGYDLELMASQLAAVPDAGPDLPATHGA